MNKTLEQRFNEKWHLPTHSVAPDEPRVPREWYCFLQPDGTIIPFNQEITPSILAMSKTILVREVIP